jgi:hypothetical protein
VGVKSDHTFGETVFMRAASGALHGGQGANFYPGQLYVQSGYCSPMSGGLRGKGTGNTAFLFNEGNSSPDFLHYLALHETGHCLYGVHSWNEPGYAEAFHDPSHAYVCIMGPAKNLESATDTPKSLRTFCGKCSAGLRGMLVMEPPLYPASDSSQTGAPKPGDAKTARKPKLGSVTGGLVLQPQPTTDPHPTPPQKPPKDTDTIVKTADTIVVDESLDVIVDYIAFMPQEQPSWCWAAVSQMMREYYRGELITQPNLVQAATGQKADTMFGLLLVGLTCQSSGEGKVLPFDEIVTEIDSNRPFIVGNLDHYWVCYGYVLQPQTVLVWNPMPVGRGAKERKTYKEYCDLITGQGGKGANYYKFKQK